CPVSGARRALLSVPTRRSSDLEAPGPFQVGGIRRPLRGVLVLAEQRFLAAGRFQFHEVARAQVARAPLGERDAGLDAGGGEESRSEEHTSELQSRENLVCRLLL